MDRFHELTVYVAVAEEQSFAGASRRLSLSPPAVTRAIAALEQRLAVKLLHRTTRHVRVTSAGQRFLSDARGLLQQLSIAEEAAAGIHAEPRGNVSITAPVLFGRTFVTPALVGYLQQYPQTQVSALFLDRIVSMLEEGVDVGVRIGQLPDSSLRAQRVGQIRQVVVASPEYLKLHGIPQHPGELKSHTIISSSAGNNALDWRFEWDGVPHNVNVLPRLKSSTNDSVIAAATSGFGITRVLSYQVANQLASGELKILLEPFESEPRPIHVVHQEGRNASAKVRALVDYLVDHLRKQPALN